MFDKITHKHNVYPGVLGFNYFKQPIPESLDKYDFVFICSDFGYPIKKNIVQFLTGAEKRYPNTYSWCSINFDDITPLHISEFTEVPSVGFVGRIPLFNNNGKTILHPGFEPRYHSAISLIESSEICFDHHIRWEPEGPSCSFFPAIANNHKKDAPLFRNNLNANQYNLCARGNGNYSQRLYETLASGRIPVYIDSGGRIPFDHFIDYREMDCFVWVDDPKETDKKVLEFHETHELKKTQIRCRRIYDEFLSPVAQARLFEEHINDFKKFELF